MLFLSSLYNIYIFLQHKTIGKEEHDMADFALAKIQGLATRKLNVKFWIFQAVKGSFVQV